MKQVVMDGVQGPDVDISHFQYLFSVIWYKYIYYSSLLRAADLAAESHRIVRRYSDMITHVDQCITQSVVGYAYKLLQGPRSSPGEENIQVRKFCQITVSERLIEHLASSGAWIWTVLGYLAGIPVR
jgi:hypothetical protein